MYLTDTVTLDGSASSDVDGDLLEFNWSFTSIPSGSNATLSDETAVMPTFDADLPGIYVARLIVNDGTVDSAPDTAYATAATPFTLKAKPCALPSTTPELHARVGRCGKGAQQC